ncbi:MAG TPA: hypothetical protein VJ397_06530 [Thermoplasmata archaeon]|nr:hypothetical protein [Thermoplasmata archaeon]
MTAFPWPVSAWKVGADGLLLSLHDGGEVAVVCRCGRHHWAVAEARAPVALLRLRCHGCGADLRVALEPAKSPS